MDLRARISTDISVLLTNGLDLGAARATIERVIRQAYDTGTGVDQANGAFGDQRAVAGSATDSLDLAGALAGSLGGNLTFTAIKEILVYALPTNTTNLLVGKAVTNAFVGPFGAGAVGISVAPGGLVHLRNPTAAGWAVTVATGDILAVENTGGTAANFLVILIGEAA